ncbi:hypothetical protein BDB01DRAFT_846704 [Pilobolus umbonatus]|nr:hypothetical protein BDB01DRAFT_846704 [Pilobolus umbonatus]
MERPIKTTSSHAKHGHTQWLIVLIPVITGTIIVMLCYIHARRREKRERQVNSTDMIVHQNASANADLLFSTNHNHRLLPLIQLSPNTVNQSTLQYNSETHYDNGIDSPPPVYSTSSLPKYEDITSTDSDNEPLSSLQARLNTHHASY